MLLHSGYHSLPRKKMLWELKPDCHNALIADSIRRDTAVAVIKSLHFCDNAGLDGDGYYKVRPIINNINKASSKWNANDSEDYAVDEIMVPYFGRHGTKQFIQGKPVRYGYKIWAICTSDGRVVWVEPYCGKDTRIEDQGAGQGPNVVLDLVAKAGLIEGSHVYFDNLFTSFPLLEQLSELRIGGTGTVRQNKLNKVPIKGKKELEKKAVPRGTADVLYQADQVLVAWKDNKAVYMASNIHGADMEKTCRRYSRVEKREIQVGLYYFPFCK
jgi:DNA excision repair protein ERCC-6